MSSEKEDENNIEENIPQENIENNNEEKNEHNPEENIENLEDDDLRPFLKKCFETYQRFCIPVNKRLETAYLKCSRRAIHSVQQDKCLPGFFKTMEETNKREGIIQANYDYYEKFYEIFNKHNMSDLYVAKVNLKDLKI